MKKLTKILSLILVSIILTAYITGCTSNEVTYFNALLNNQSIKSMDSKTEITLNLQVSGLSEREQQSAKNILPMLNSSKLTLNQKLTSNEDKTNAKSQIDANVEFGGMGMKAGMWVDYDFTGSQTKFKEIFRLPLIVTMGFPERFKGKEYMVFDYDKMPKTLVTNKTVSLKQAIELNNSFRKGLTDFLKKYIIKFNPGFEVVKLKENKVVSGESLPVYELKLNDESFKELIRYTVNNTIENKEIMDLVRQYMISVSNIYNLQGQNNENTQANIDKMLNNFEGSLPQFKDSFNKVMDALKDVKVIGDKGIVIDCAINKDGYIVNEASTIDLVIDSAAIEIALSKLKTDNKVRNDTVTSKGIYNLTLNYDTTINNINKATDINFPELNDQNSFNIEDLQEPTKPLYK